MSAPRTPAPKIEDPFFDTHAAAEYLDVAQVTLERWRSKFVGPEWIKLSGGICRYRKSALDAYLEACTRTPPPGKAAA